MHILIKNKKLSIDSYKVKCAIGKRGIKLKKREGDLITPKGIFKIKYILYRKDRISNFKSKIKKIIIHKNLGWCDDPKELNETIENSIAKNNFSKNSSIKIKDYILDKNEKK